MKITHISASVGKAISFIEKRQRGEEPFLSTGFSKLDDALMGGIPWNTILTIAGLSGVGKSTLLQMLTESLTIDESVTALQFKFEMLPTDELTRLASAKVGKSLKEIYSARKPLPDDVLKDVKASMESLTNRAIFTVERAGTSKEIIDTIKNFVAENSVDKLIVTLDHTLLIKGDDEKGTIDRFMKDLVDLKKLLAQEWNIRCIFIILSQLNRGLETPSRAENCYQHYPNKNDIFAASSVYYSSDFVLIIHKPCLVDGITNWYGPPTKGFPNGLPVFNPDNPEQPMIYFHLIKERFGMPKILAMLDSLEHSLINEANL